MENTKVSRRQKRQKGNGYKYDHAFKLRVAKHYAESAETLIEIGRRFNVCHQQVSRWGKELSAELAAEIIVPHMTDQEKQDMDALQARLQMLEKKLEYEQMKNFALETMVDLAKSELGIDLRKNSGAKQPKE